MKHRTFLIIVAAAYAIFGLAFLLIPALFLSVLGVALDEGGIFMTRAFGAAMIGFMFIYWWSRNEPASPVLLAVLRASAIYNLIALLYVLFATFAGVLNGLGWMLAVLHLTLVLGFGFFGFMERAQIPGLAGR